MEFAIGDEVRILVKKVPTIDLKYTRWDVDVFTNGVIDQINPGTTLPFHVRYRDFNDNYQSWWFAAIHLELAGTIHLMVEPVFDLDDLELAQMIMDDMKDA